MWQAVRDTLSLLSVKFGGNQRHPTWGTNTAKLQGELDLKGDKEMGDQDNSGKVWRWQEDDWGERCVCVCVRVCVCSRARARVHVEGGSPAGEGRRGGAWAGAGIPGSPVSPAQGLPYSWHCPLQWTDRPLRSLPSLDSK